MELWQVWAAAITAICGLIGALYLAWARKEVDGKSHELATFDSINAEMRALRTELKEAIENSIEAKLEVVQCRREHAEALVREGEYQERINQLENSNHRAHERIRELNELVGGLRKDVNGFGTNKGKD